MGDTSDSQVELVTLNETKCIKVGEKWQRAHLGCPGLVGFIPLMLGYWC